MKIILFSLLKNLMLVFVCVVVLAACDDSGVVDVVADSIVMASE